MKNKNDKELSIEQEVTRDCPILFRMRRRPYSETCMSFGFECGEGWHEYIASACRELEMLNVQYYPKYRVRIQADQIKEKFGTLRFYWSVCIDPNRFVTWLGHKFESIADWLSYYKRFDYKMTKIVDVEPYDYDETKELTKEQYECQKAYKYTASNVELKEENGKYLEICHLHNYGKYHMVPTKHKILWHIKEICDKIRCKCLYQYRAADTAAIRNCVEYMNRQADKIVRDAENECTNHCEECGSQIGTKWSPACMTTGWITYICDICAEKYKGQYIKNGELWQGDKMLKSKDEMKKDKRFAYDEEV